MWDELAGWWGAVELWLAQQWFPVQFLLIMTVLVPLCLGVTVLGDRIGDAISRRRARRVARSSTRRTT